MEIFALLAILIIVIYGLLTGYASYNQFKTGRIQPWAAVGMFAVMLLLFGSGFLLGESSPFTFPILFVALLGLHALAIVNGLHLNGKINIIHHVGRGILSLVLILLVYLALS